MRFIEALGDEEVRINNDFFQLTGHTLNTTSPMNRIDDPFGISLTLRALLKAGTVANLADLLQ